MTPVDAYDLTLRLSGTDVPSGQIDLDSLASLGTALQELATRIGRLVIGQSGPGRTAAPAAKAVQLRLAGLHAGSTVLDIAVGEGDMLPMELGVEAEIAERFWDVIEGVRAGSRPDWVTPLVADSALRLLDAATHAASDLEIVRRDGRRSTWRRPDLVRDPWVVPRRVTEEAAVTISGRLEKVDLKDGSFRIRDDVGNAIALLHVTNAEDVSNLVGNRAEATGTPSYDSAGRLVALERPTLTQDLLPTELTLPSRTDLDALFAVTPGPDPRGIEGLTSAEVDAFLFALHL